MKPLGKNTSILSVFAHRDDWLLFGFPILQNEEYIRLLYLITAEYYDINAGICEKEKIVLVGNAGLLNRFSFQLERKQARSYAKILKLLKKLMAIYNPDYILTHNPMGEYGHADHKFLFSLLYNNFDIPLLITDIMSFSRHCVCHKKIPKEFEWCYKNKILEVEPDKEFYGRNRKIFMRAKAWTANRFLNEGYPTKTSLYVVE